MSSEIGAVILAAGRSQRMGTPKLVLPWGTRTVIEQVVISLQQAGIEDILLVTGGSRELVEQVLNGYRVRFTHNREYAALEMLTSLQTGIRASDPTLEALLVVLGDQPALEPDVIHSIIRVYQQCQAKLVIPSYQMRRGHPWLVKRCLWDDLLAMPAKETLRDFLQAHQEEIVYANVDTPTILSDLDTPEDYQRQRP